MINTNKFSIDDFFLLFILYFIMGHYKAQKLSYLILRVLIWKIYELVEKNVDLFYVLNTFR